MSLTTSCRNFIPFSDCVYWANWIKCDIFDRFISMLLYTKSGFVQKLWKSKGNQSDKKVKYVTMFRFLNGYFFIRYLIALTQHESISFILVWAEKKKKTVLKPPGSKCFFLFPFISMRVYRFSFLFLCLASTESLFAINIGRFGHTGHSSNYCVSKVWVSI